MGNHLSENLKHMIKKKGGFHSNFPTVVDPSDVVDQTRLDFKAKIRKCMAYSDHM